MNRFLAEILEQPNSLESTLEYYSGSLGENRLKKIARLIQKEDFQQIIFTGMGSSYFTSYAASCLFNSLGIHSVAVNTSELIYYHSSLLNEKTLVVCISQSGESFEVVKFLELIPKNIFCIGITNEEESSLSRKSLASVLSVAGKEEMTSTKTYTSITLIMYIIAWYLKGMWGKEKISEIRKLITDVKELLSNYKTLIDDELNFFGEVDFMQFIGRGPSFSTALQSELMFKEAAKIPAAGTLGGEFRHGPMEMVMPGFNSILFAAEGQTYAQSILMATDIAKYQGKVIIVTNMNPHLSDSNIRTITIDQPNEFLFSIQSIIPVQLMVNYLALAKGYEPGNFVHGGKVTLTE
ncbi:MAG: SIS domain-containing protein [Ignavibacteriaceae bacterium]